MNDGYNGDNIPIPQKFGSAGKGLNTLYFGGSGLLVFIAFFGMLLPTIQRQQRVFQTRTLYQAQCGTAEDVIQSTASCQESRAKIVDRYTTGSGSIMGWWLNLQIPNGHQYSVSLMNHALWDSTHMGEQVTVQVWNNHITLVQADGQTSQTGVNPEVIDSSNGAALIAGLFVLDCGSIICVMPFTNKQWATAQFKRPVVFTMIVFGSIFVARVLTR